MLVAIVIVLVLEMDKQPVIYCWENLRPISVNALWEFFFSFQISSAACGYGFTLLSSKTKDITKVWGMGLNKDSQLGFHRSQKDKSKDSHLGFSLL